MKYMKYIFATLLIIISFSTSLSSQITPQEFYYSAVARNASGQPIIARTVGIQISIIKGSSTGQIKYSENHFVITDDLGLFNLLIGTGAIQSGSLASINWSNDNYYLKVGMDTNGGTNFLTMGTTQLLSVPYAKHAKTAESLVSSGGSGGNFTHYIGEEFGGGVIFHLWKDIQLVEHGLIVDKVDLDTSHVWNNMNTFVGTTAQSFWDGLSNSNAIVSQIGHTSSAAALCLNSTNGGFGDWYLPAIDELDKLYKNRISVNTTLRSLPSAEEFRSDYQLYWSSTEDSSAYAWSKVFDIITHNGTADKNWTLRVRAIRSF